MTVNCHIGPKEECSAGPDNAPAGRVCLRSPGIARVRMQLLFTIGKPGGVTHALHFGNVKYSYWFSQRTE